jgi:hypothetical protein
MSTFTLGLAILGGLVLAILVAWNAWSTRKLAPRQADAPVARAESVNGAELMKVFPDRAVLSFYRLYARERLRGFPADLAALSD